MKIEIGDEEIERVKSFKYLGVYLDEVMTYKEHASKVVKKTSSRIGVLSKVVRYVKLDYGKLLFNTIILPHFDYCSQMWSNSTKLVLDPIIKLQKSGGRILIGAPRLTPTKHVFKELKWTDISSRWQQQNYAWCSRYQKVMHQSIY